MRVLYTVVDPDEKYKAQNFIDTVVYRGGDAASGWMFSLFGKTLGLSAIATIAATLPLAGLWLFASLGLGAMHKRKAGP
jgi:ATP:ADP antiporter, AAA family